MKVQFTITTPDNPIISPKIEWPFLQVFDGIYLHRDWIEANFPMFHWFLVKDPEEKETPYSGVILHSLSCYNDLMANIEDCYISIFVDNYDLQ